MIDANGVLKNDGYGMNGVMSEENGGESFKHDMRDFELGRAFVKVESHG